MKHVLNILGGAIVAVSMAATPAAFAAQDESPATEVVDASAYEGEMIYDGNGRRIGAVYSVTPDGAPQVIISGKLYTIPSDSLSVADGKLSTSMTKKEIVLSAR